MKKSILIFTSIAMAILGLSIPLNPVYAEWNNDEVCKMDPERAGCNTSTNATNFAVTLINVVIGILGVVAIAMIIFGGINFTISQGDPEKVKRAKNIILYSVVGLVVAILSFAIVNFVSSSIAN